VTEPTSPARPLDFFDSTPPRLWQSEDRLAIINFADEPAEIELPEGSPRSGTDFWTDQRVELGSAVTLPPHGSLLVKY
jgi:hypothetical protein